MMFGTRETFDYGRCQACGSIAIATVPSDMSRHYPPGYYSLGTGEPGPAPGFLRRRAAGIVSDGSLFGRPHRRITTRLARKLVGPGQKLGGVRAFVEAANLSSLDAPILDVGSGSQPTRLAELRRLGFRKLQAIEPFIAADTTYQGVRVRKADLSLVSGRFRLIMFHHSLEHVPDPRQTLSRARALLDADGRCQVRTPVMGAGMWQRYGPDWVELDPPRHLAVFSRTGFERMAAAAGFDIAAVNHESSDWELIASEQYRRDIAMSEPRSHFVDPSGGPFDVHELEAFRRDASHLNETEQSGRVSYWLRPVGS